MIEGLFLEKHQKTHPPPEAAASELFLLVEDFGRGWDHQTGQQG